jgi:hypothetical protein
MKIALVILFLLCGVGAFAESSLPNEKYTGKSKKYLTYTYESAQLASSYTFIPNFQNVSVITKGKPQKNNDQSKNYNN